MDVLGIFSAFGLSASAGLNAYIPLLTVALLARFTTLIKLDEPWTALTSWWIIGLLVVLSLIEFFADKIPAVNHINDIIQTFVRPAAGAIVFAASAKVITEIHPVLAMGLGLMVAGAVHGTKALVVRPVVTATTGGTANAAVSALEDVVSTTVSVLAIVVPIVAAVVTVLLAIWLVSLIVRRSRRKAESAALSAQEH